MGRIYERGKNWYVDYAVHGESIRQRVSTSKTLAESVLKERESEVRRGEHPHRKTHRFSSR